MATDGNTTEINLDTDAGRLAGLARRRKGAPKVLCLHGWMDNAASFAPLSEHLSELDLVAVDFPGHGHSQHRHPSTHYYFADYLWDIEAAMDALGWSACHLLGHSLGAAVASVYAAASPARVKSLVTLDALGPYTREASNAADQFRRSMESTRGPGRRIKAYESMDDMIDARRRNSEFSNAAARLICERAAWRKGKHFEWRTDPRLHWVSPQLMNEEQVINYLQHIESPLLSITATPFARYVPKEKFEARKAAIPHGQHELIAGHHHFHMDNPEPVATMVQSFILQQENPE
jgi:pimeloyl-ACP methyl ester carboxylesterase